MASAEIALACNLKIRSGCQDRLCYEQYLNRRENTGKRVPHRDLASPH